MAGNVQAVYLTEEDHALLKQVISNQKQRPINPPIRPTPPPIPNRVRAMYLALPETEITALTTPGSASGSGSGSGGESGDVPGFGLCTLYRLVDGELQHLSNHLEWVYNSSRTAIDRDWVQVHQDNFGVWWAITGGGTVEAAELVLFELTQVYCPETGTGTGSGTGTGATMTLGLPIKTTCNGTLPTGEQEIIDDLGCFLTGPELLLIGQLCWCVRTTGGTLETCAYSIISMCCADATC